MSRLKISAIAIASVFATTMVASAQPDVLLLTKSSGFEHDVVKESGGPSVVEDKVAAAVASLGGTLTATKDASTINTANLANFDVVIFFTSGDLTTSGTDGNTPMSGTGVDELNAWIMAGGGFIGYHSATDTFHNDQDYIDMIGAEFDQHGSQFSATLINVAPAHPVMTRVPATWTLTEEYYEFKNVVPTGRTPLLEIPDSPNYALVWTNDFGSGRVLYNQLAHNESTWDDTDFQNMLEDSISWAASGVVTPPTPVIDFQASTVNVAENAGTAVLTVNLSVAPGTGNSVTVDYDTENGTAIAGSHYTAASGTLTINDTDTSGVINITILDNMILDGDQSFGVRLTNPTVGVFAGADPLATVVIEDNEVAPPTPDIDFQASTVNVAENAGTAVLTVNLSVAPGTGNSVTVDYDTENGTAFAGSDFTAASGTLTISDTNTSGVINITILDNTSLEGEESFGVRLSNPTGGVFAKADPLASVVIADNEIDTDLDTISDEDETLGTFGYVTNPNLWDTDGDGIGDFIEIALGFDPTSAGSVPPLSTFRIPFARD